MANLVLFQGNRYSGDIAWVVQYYGAQTSTNFEILDSSGILRQSHIGTNFTYGSNGFFSSGTETEISSFSINGKLASQLTNANIDVATRNSLLSAGTSAYDYYQYVYRGNDSFLGSASDDSFLGSKGNDTINGGTGVDVLTFQKFSEGVTVNLLTSQAITSYGTSTISNVEDVEGSGYNDVLTGNSGNNQIQGFGGADQINGGAGFDTVAYFDATSAVNVNLSTGVVTGGSGNDSLISIERVLGSRFNDVLIGSAANESFLGGFGADSINGGGGTDTIEYDFVGSGVVVNLTTGLASGGAGNDVISNIENVKGSIFNDSLVGNAVANSLNGDSGNDSLNGGAGKDTLTGGTGSDAFVFQFGQSPVTGSDRLTDFAIGTDKIDLLTSTGASTAAPTRFSRAADFTATATSTLTNVVNSVFANFDGAGAGTSLAANSASLVKVSGGSIAGTYLIVNDPTAAFSATSDLVINLTGYSGILPGTSAGTAGLSVSSVFI